MAHIYMSFDFGTDEEKAQLARHKLEMWKQAFRLDKKLLFKFERESQQAAAGEETPQKSEKPAKAAKPAKSSKAERPAKSKSNAHADQPAAGGNGKVKLYLRFAFSGHEKMTEERMLKKIPSEEPFSGFSPKAVRDGDAAFGDLEAKFDSLE